MKIISDRQLSIVIGTHAVDARNHWRNGDYPESCLAAAAVATALLPLPVLLWAAVIAWLTGGTAVRVGLVFAACSACATVVLSSAHERLRGPADEDHRPQVPALHGSESGS